MNSQIIGGFTPFSSEIDADAKQAFEEAMKPLLGVDYEPVAVASQVVNGINYAFFCNSTVVAPGAPTRPAMVSIFKPREGTASITHIERLPY